MKNKILFLLMAVITFACNSNDDDATQDQNSIVGQWRITTRTVDQVMQSLGECEPNSVYTYNADNSYTELHYAAIPNSPCLNNPSQTFNGTWSVNTDGSYSFTSANNQSSNYQVTFQSNDVFTRTFTGITDPNDPTIQTIVERFTRIP